MSDNHISIDKLSYSSNVKTWLEKRYGKEHLEKIWIAVVDVDEYVTETDEKGFLVSRKKLMKGRMKRANENSVVLYSCSWSYQSDTGTCQGID